MNVRNHRQRITDSFAAATYIPRNSLGVIPAANIEKKKKKKERKNGFIEKLKLSGVLDTT